MNWLKVCALVLGLVGAATLAAALHIPALYAATFGYGCGVAVTALIMGRR